MAVAAVAGVGLWAQLHQKPWRGSRSLRARAAPPATTALAVRSAAPTAAPSATPVPQVAAPGSASGAPSAPSVASAAGTSAAMAPEAVVLGDAGASDGDDTIPVRINIWPEGTRLYLRGRPVGRAPFTLRIPRGTKHVYEAVLPGYAPRRVIIDGSKKVVDVSLKKEELESEQPSPTPATE